MRPGCGLRRGTGSFNVPPLGALCLPVLLALLVWLAAAPVTAHEGHDLEIPESPGASRAVPRLVADSESYELVAVLEGQRLVIYLDRFEDNSPVTDANMIVTINEEPVVAQATGNGTYSVTSTLFERGGLFEFVFDIKAPEGDDLLIGKLTLPSAGAAGALANPMPWYTQVVSTIRHGAEDHSVLMTLTLLAGLALGIGLRRRRRAYLVPILVLALPALAITAIRQTARPRWPYGRRREGRDDTGRRTAAIARRQGVRSQADSTHPGCPHHYCETEDDAEGGGVCRSRHRQSQPQRPRPEHHRRTCDPP